MAAPPVKSRPLHNFSLPRLEWAHRFRRTDPEATIRPVVNDHPTQFQQEVEEQKRPEEEEEEEEEEHNRKIVKPWKLRSTRKLEALQTTAFSKKETVSKTDRAHTTNDDHDNKKNSSGPRVVVKSSQRRAPKKIWISLSIEEIEEDVYAVTGGKPSRKPRKWPKNVQKQLDNVFPGLYLVGYTADSYRVMMR